MAPSSTIFISIPSADFHILQMPKLATSGDQFIRDTIRIRILLSRHSAKKKLE